MVIVWLIISVMCCLLGMAGCIIPALPGPLFSYGAVLLLKCALPHSALSTSFFIFWGIIVIVASLSDNILPLLGAKLYGASKYGIWGSIIGMIIGLFFFPPFGLIVGLFLGALTGEIIGGRSYEKAFQSSMGTVIASIFVFVMKSAVTMALVFYYVKALISALS